MTNRIHVFDAIVLRFDFDGNHEVSSRASGEERRTGGLEVKLCRRLFEIGFQLNGGFLTVVSWLFFEGCLRLLRDLLLVILLADDFDIAVDKAN